MTATPEEIARARGMRRYSQPKRSGKTPEAKVSAAIDKYLKRLGFYVLRTGAGMAEIDGRKIQIGRTGGHDRTCCAPNGRFVSIEIKAPGGKPTDAQLRQRDFILLRQGVVIIPDSVPALRAGLVVAFGETEVARWER
jgi:hypothetical protein